MRAVPLEAGGGRALTGWGATRQIARFVGMTHMTRGMLKFIFSFTTSKMPNSQPKLFNLYRPLEVNLLGDSRFGSECDDPPIHV
jgi:hypothetical protein